MVMPISTINTSTVLILKQNDEKDATKSKSRRFAVLAVLYHFKVIELREITPNGKGDFMLVYLDSDWDVVVLADEKKAIRDKLKTVEPMAFEIEMEDPADQGLLFGEQVI